MSGFEWRFALGAHHLPGLEDGGRRHGAFAGHSGAEDGGEDPGAPKQVGSLLSR